MTFQQPLKILLMGPTALDAKGQPIKQKKLHLPGLTLPLLAALTPQEHYVRLLCETVEDVPYDEHWDLIGITGMGSGLFRAWEIADIFSKFAFLESGEQGLGVDDLISCKIHQTSAFAHSRENFGVDEAAC